MKKYVRICYYTDKADVVLAFLSSLLLIYIGLCYTGQLSECLYKPYISSEYLAGGVLAVNYVMLVGANPLRIFLAVFLLPARLIVVLLKPFLLVLSIASLAAAAGAGADASRALKKKDKIGAARHAKEMAKFGAIGAASIAGSNYSSGMVGTRIRSMNGAYIRRAPKEKPHIEPLPEPQYSAVESSPTCEKNESLPKKPKHKSPLLAGWLSVILPGLGQMYCGRIGRGLLYPLLYVVLVAVVAYYDAVGVFLLMIVVIPATSCLDARRLARQYKK